MNEALLRATGAPIARGLLRSSPEDFRVYEELGFELTGEGEHVFLQLQKRNLNTLELQQRIAKLSGIPERDIGISGLKDRNAVTIQWFSVRMAGKPEPDWQALSLGGEPLDVEVLQIKRHQRKLKRGVHRANRFTLVLRDFQGEPEQLEQRLVLLRDEGFPNYFGEQRFGKGGSTIIQARRWMDAGGRKISRTKRSLYLSAMRSGLFNSLLAERVAQGSWNRVQDGDMCMLQGTRSQFSAEVADESLQARACAGDLHPALPLWGRFSSEALVKMPVLSSALVKDEQPVCDFLERAGMDLAWRPARALADDFCWQFCDDASLQLDFTLGAGSYATALLAEFVHYS